jgi:transposase-like protein
MSKSCSLSAGLQADHTTLWRWAQRYGPTLEQRLHRHLKPTNKSWRVDETYIRVKGRWCYLYRAIDSPVPLAPERCAERLTLVAAGGLYVRFR